MKTIGIFGGSFNPLHVGHISLAHQIRSIAGLDEVWLMVSPQNPLKKGSNELLDDRMRFLLTRAALHGESGLRASDYEFHLPRPSYTWLTLQHMVHDYPNVRFVLIIGGDNWRLFPRWYHAADILSHHQVIVYPRRESQAQAPPSAPKGATILCPQKGLSIVPPPGGEGGASTSGGEGGASPLFVNAALMDISSTDIRQRVYRHEDISQLVPRPIAPLVRRLYTAHVVSAAPHSTMQ